MTYNARRSMETRAVHGARTSGANPWGAVATPIVLSNTHVIESSAALETARRGEHELWEYGRYANPTVAAAEEHIAALEGAERSLLFSSGMAALAGAALSLLRPGQHVVWVRDCYRPSGQLFSRVLADWGIRSTGVDALDSAALEAALSVEQTRLLFVELPTNPRVLVPDVPAMIAMAHARRGVKVLVDATLASPVLATPLSWGADLVMHSATKFLAGHNDLLAGVLSGRAALMELVEERRSLLGSVLDPHAAYLLMRGMKTLGVRVDAQCRSASELARRLAEHPRVDRVWYPTLAGHPGVTLTETLLGGRGGAVLAFALRGGEVAARLVVDRVRLVRHAASLGGTETLIQQPSLFSYADLSEEERRAEGIDDGLLRLSVGLEHVEDLWQDLTQALDEG